jgi:hypothetical protein
LTALLLGLVQHEQVKVEIMQQNMIHLLVRCVIEKHSFHSVKIQQYAMEILLALCFNDSALSILEKESDLIKCLATLKNSNEGAIQRAANHLSWQLERKHNISIAIASDVVSKSKSKLDIMISYSHSGKKLCFQICEFLEKDGFHVWIDRDRMHGDAIVAMADAIENSEFVIICMSESYKLSPYCQAEATYAFQRRRKLVPLVMKAKHKPDVWLGFITSGKIYVDYTKHEFDLACSLLKGEIIANKSKILELTHEPIHPSSSLMTIDQCQAPM